VEALKNAGLTEVSCDTEVWKQVWTEEEIANNGSTPIFLLSGKKRESFFLFVFLIRKISHCDCAKYY